MKFTPDPKVTVEDVIGWASSGLHHFDKMQDDESEKKRIAAKSVIPILIGLIAYCEGKDSIAAVKECMIKVS